MASLPNFNNLPVGVTVPASVSARFSSATAAAAAAKRLADATAAVQSRIKVLTTQLVEQQARLVALQKSLVTNVTQRVQSLAAAFSPAALQAKAIEAAKARAATLLAAAQQQSTTLSALKQAQNNLATLQAQAGTLRTQAGSVVTDAQNRAITAARTQIPKVPTIPMI